MWAQACGDIHSYSRPRGTDRGETVISHLAPVVFPLYVVASLSGPQLG
jgi:hypothetical protein